MKRIIFLLIFILLLSACNIGDTSIDEQTDDINKLADLDGYVFQFKFTESVHGSFKPIEGETIIGDNTLIRYKETEDNLNCKIYLEAYDQAKIKAVAAVGDQYADLIYLNLTNLYDLYKNDMLYSLDDIKEMDFSTEKFGYPNLLDAASIKGHRYGFFPLYWGMPTAGFCNALYFNNENIKSFGQPLPHEFLEKKEWTWDKFEEVCKAVTSESSNKEDNTYAIGMTTDHIFIQAAVASNGVSFVTTDENGLYKENITDPRIIQALQWSVDMNNKGYFEDTKDSWQVSQDGFIAGRYSFLPEYAWLGLIRTDTYITVKMEKAFGWAPFPVGPAGTFGKWGTDITDENYYMAFPATLNSEVVIPVVNYLFEPFTGETTESWKENLLRMSFFEKESLKYYLEMLQSAKFDYSIMLQESPTSIPLINVYNNILKGKYTPLEALEPYRERVQKELDKWN